ncbi:MAG: TIGR00159 family protein, partial [Eudoraea sp.]|nr:TIGR00159 family protein [Eudoraea sp.]
MDFFNFLDIKITDIIDILLVATLLYYIYKLVRGTVAINIFIGIVIVWGFWKLTQLLDMKMISSVVGGFMSVGLIALIVVFQQEIRKFLLMIGSTNFARNRNFVKKFKFLKQEDVASKLDIDAVLKACDKMSRSRTGAILVIKRSNSLDFVKSSGDAMNVEVNQPIIESIFYKNSPLHDGAAIIENNQIT